MSNKRKILHVIGIMDYGGAETMIMNLFRRIDHVSYQFDFLVHRNRKGQYDDEIIELGGEIFYLPEFKVINSVQYRYACKSFFQTHKDYSVVHGHIESCASIYLDEAKKQGMPTIAHCHSTGFKGLISKNLYNYLTRRTKRTADYFLACSMEAGENRFGRKIVASNKFEVFNNGIDLEKYRFSEERNASLKIKWGLENKTIIGHVGRLSKEKNQEFLLQVFAKIYPYYKNIIMIFVGDGPQRRYLENITKKMNISDRVIFTGSRDDISNMMNLFDVFVFPSIYEGLGIALIEAQAAGLPCLVSDAIVEEAIVSDNVYRLKLTDPVCKWVDVITKQLVHIERKDGCERVKKAGFDINETVRRLEKIYNFVSKRDI